MKIEIEGKKMRRSGMRERKELEKKDGKEGDRRRREEDKSR